MTLDNDKPVNGNSADSPISARVARNTVVGVAGLLVAAAALVYLAGPKIAPTDSSATTEGPTVTTSAPAGPPANLPPASSDSQAATQMPASDFHQHDTPSAPVEEAQVVPRAVTTTRIPRVESQSPLESQERSTSTSSLNDRAAALPSEDILFVQRARVNVRSEPSRKGRVVGTVERGGRVKVIGRSGNWVHVETNTGIGWISGSLLGPTSIGTR
jgi:hypothetical protein